MTIVKKNGPIHNIDYGWHPHRPHWKAYGEGGASLEVTTHDDAKWVSLDAVEWTATHTKRTMLTLNEEQGRILYNRLKEIYE